MVGVAPEPEVRQLVSPPVVERNPVVDLEPVVAAADDACRSRRRTWSRRRPHVQPLEIFLRSFHAFRCRS